MVRNCSQHFGGWVTRDEVQVRCDGCDDRYTSVRVVLADGGGDWDRGGDREMTEHEKKLVRNSTAEFLIFISTAGEESIEVRYEDETIWLSQKMMAALFDVGIPTINEHLKNIFETGELARDATIRKFRTVRTEGIRDVSRKYPML